MPTMIPRLHPSRRMVNAQALDWNDPLLGSELIDDRHRYSQLLAKGHEARYVGDLRLANRLYQDAFSVAEKLPAPASACLVAGLLALNYLTMGQEARAKQWLAALKRHSLEAEPGNPEGASAGFEALLNQLMEGHFGAT